jgi:NAD(P)-dependent dehydrogenase (short-subunit alcohol dehydrogenase family)
LFWLPKWEQLDVWVNNAAIGSGGGLLETTEEQWDKVMAVNAKGSVCNLEIFSEWYY